MRFATTLANAGVNERRHERYVLVPACVRACVRARDVGPRTVNRGYAAHR